MRRAEARGLAAAAAVGLFAVACGGSESEVPTQPFVAGTVNNGVISVPVSIEGAKAQPFVVDTGAVLTRLDPARFAALGIQPGLDQVTTLDIGTIHLTEVDVVAASLCGTAMACQGTEPAGLLGGAVLSGFQVTIDYRGAAVAFGTFTAPEGLGSPTTTPFALQGGGQSDVSGSELTVPATRIAVEVNIEGNVVPMVLDTGSSTMILDSDLYDTIVGDGRPQTSIDINTVTGTKNATLTTLHSVALAGAGAQTGIQAVRAPLDLSGLATEVGHPIKGLLGGAYLQHYLTTIDYPGRIITLRPY
jgi:predicted aspartyl protease